jgi:purine nucleosidase
MSCRQVALVLAAFLVVGGCASPGDAAANEEGLSCRGRGRPVPVVFDTDMDFDDAAALAYLCAEHHRGNIELLAVTVENDGAGMPGSAIRHARCVLAACGLPQVPIADGSATGVHAVSPELHGAVELVLEGAFASCTEGVQPGAVPAPELLARAIRGADQPVVLTTGPLTNVAAALAASPHHHGPRLADQIGRIVIMGGAFDVPGNLLGTGTETFDGTQELNVWADPAAFASVLAARPGLVSIVPLDSTAYVPVTNAFVAQLAGDQHSPEAAIVLSIAQQPIVQFGISIGAFFWWDPLAAIAATQREQVVDFDLTRVSVVTDASAASSGRTTESRRGALAFVGRSADTTGFETAFLDGLNRRD